MADSESWTAKPQPDARIADLGRRARSAGADRDHPAARATRADPPGQRVQDDAPLDLIVRLHTDAGVVSEAYVGDEDAALAEIDLIVREEIAPRILGEDVFAVERLWKLARPSTFDILRDRRLGLVACAGIDTAVWDAVGKALGQPLWRLWGGYRNTISMTSIGGYYSSDADIPAEVASRERGLAGMKFKVGGLRPKRMRAFRRPARRAGLRADGRREPGVVNI